MYCKAGDKPTVTYQFTGQNQKVFKSNFSPIDVITQSVPINSTNNYSTGGFGIYVYATNFNFQGNLVVRDYYVIDTGAGAPISTRYALYTRDCSSSIFTTGLCISTPSPTINPNTTCTVVEPQKTAIQVIYNGLVIFQDQAQGTVNFSVKCGNCPGETCECPSPSYPGYCCLDCDSISSKINQIISQVKQLN